MPAPSAISITNLDGKPVCGRCQFTFRGFLVSVSTVFPHASDRVMVIDFTGAECFTSYTVEEAITWIEAQP